MNSLIKKLAVGAATLAIASAPLVASAQDWHHDNGHRGQVIVHERIVNNNAHYGYVHPQYHQYHRWHEGYYGVAPAGFHGYYHNGGWYHHRRQQAGLFIYF